MSISLLALQRARKQLEVFCHQRSCSGNELYCQTEDDSLILQHNGQSLVRLQFDGTQWHIFWRRDNKQWILWPHLPVCNTIQRAIEELEQAPLHIHWDG